MKRFLPLLLALLAAGVSASAVLADDPPPTTTTTPPTTTAPAPAVVPEGVTVAGVAIGGMTQDAAAIAVTQAFQQPVVLRFETTTINVSPSLLGLGVPADSAVARAMTSPPYTKLGLRAGVDRQLVRAFVAKIAARFNRKPVASRLLLRNARPLVTQPVIGRALDQRRAVADLTKALTLGTRTGPVVLRAKLTQPKTTPSTIGPVVVIKRASNVLTLYNGMKKVRVFRVATGQAVYPTPLGKFEIVVKWKNPWWYPPNSDWAKGEKPVPPGPGNPLGTRWMGISSPGVGIHGTPQGGSIGYSLSHGCIRMLIPEAEWLYEHVDVGTPVFIVSR